MRADQYEKLKDLSDKLVDVVLEEANPQAWPGDAKNLANITQAERGDRYWCKKNAAASLSLVMKIQALVGVMEQRGSKKPNELEGGEEEDDLDKEVRAAEREAKRILKKLEVQSRARAPRAP